MNENNLKLAIQKEGRLTEETLQFLWKSGLEFESYKQRLFSSCRNFPLEIIYVRDNDIPDYVQKKAVDIGIAGQNILNEYRPKVKKLLNLRYGFCSLALAVPKESKILKVKDLKGKTVATSYPNASKKYFQEKNISVQIIKINGAVEITPTLGIADAVIDLTSTGSTFALNDLRIIDSIYNSEAVLIANPNIVNLEKKYLLLQKLLTRFKAVLSAKNYKYVIMNAPKIVLPKLKKTIPGLKSPTVSPLYQNDWVSVASVIKEDIFWETIEKLKRQGAEGILVIPIEKMIT